MNVSESDKFVEGWNNLRDKYPPDNFVELGTIVSGEKMVLLIMFYLHSRILKILLKEVIGQKPSLMLGESSGQKEGMREMVDSES